MAQPSRSLGYVCRSCRHALKATSPRPFAFTSLAVRSFSSTVTRSKTLATFNPTPSPELDLLLSRWRSEVFLPSILPAHHQRLIYQNSKREILVTPPGVTVTVQTSLSPSAPNATNAPEESIKLAPMNVTQRPKKGPSLKQITDVLSEHSDAATWDNVIPFLEGMRLAREQIDPMFVVRLARRANLQDAGRWNTIMAAAALAKRTGVRLSHEGLTKELVLGAHHRGATHEFKTKEPRKTLDLVVKLLDAEDHCGTMGKPGSGKLEEGHMDMRRQPIVVAARLSFASANAIQQHKGKDEDGTVASAIQQTLALNEVLRSAGGIIGAIEQGCKNESSKEPVKASQSYRDRLSTMKLVEEMAVVRCALTLAGKVECANTLGKQKNIELKAQINKLRDSVKERHLRAIKEVKGSEATDKQRRGLTISDAVEKAMKSMGAS